MRKARKKALIKAALAFFAIAAVFVLIFMCSCSSSSEEAYSEAEEHLTVESYEIEYDISSDRCISTEERIEIYYNGGTSYERLLEISNGEMVRGLEVVELVGEGEDEKEQEVEYKVASTRYHDFSLEIGGETALYGKHTYLLTYDYCLTRADDNYTLDFLALEPKQEYEIEEGHITCLLPDGYSGDAVCKLMTDGEALDSFDWTQSEEDGRTKLSTTFENYKPGDELRITMTFAAGSLSKYRDRSPLWFAVVAAGLIVVVLILKFTVFKSKRRSTGKSFNAMKRMNPLLMGKFADNRVGKEDISSLVIHWANKGYLKMDLTNPDDPSLLRTVQTLPEECKEYEKFLFYNLFKTGRTVKLSALKNKYYVLADAAAEHVNDTTKGLYDTASIIVSLVITLIGIVMMGIAPLVVAQIQVSSAVTYYMSFIVIIPALIIYAVMESLVYNSFKSSKAIKISLIVAVLVMCALTILAYVFLIPSYIVGNLSKEVISEAFCILFILAPLLIRKTKKYSAELDDITEFRNAITTATAEEIQGWYKDDPQMYYKIMPYARVIGLAQYWQDKNRGMPLPAADWAILPADFGDNPTFEQADAVQRKASEMLHNALTSRPAPREEEHEKEEHGHKEAGKAEE